MKKILALYILNLLWVAAAQSESIMKPINDLGYGTLSGRIQSLTMYRDFDTKGANGANSTMGIVLNYTTPKMAGVDAGLAYNFADEIYDNNASAILANDDINILNETWVRLNFEAINLSNTTVTVGRKINNGEVFRADDFRQKSRSIQAVQVETKDIENNRVAIGHSGRMSNWVQAGKHWEFQNYAKVFSLVDKSFTEDTDGITWGEVVNNQVEDLEIALFDAYAWDVANLFGTRVKWDFADDSALVGYYRNERDTGKSSSRNANVYAISFQQKVGNLTIEPGYFGVHGADLLFQELTTGINHPLGALMEICSCPFVAGADTAYLKAVTKIQSSKTVLYALYNFTWHDYSQRSFDGQEFNLVIKQPIVDNLTVAFKGGVGYRDGKKGTANTTDTDLRLFVTYTF